MGLCVWSRKLVNEEALAHWGCWVRRNKNVLPDDTVLRQDTNCCCEIVFPLVPYLSFVSIRIKIGENAGYILAYYTRGFFPLLWTSLWNLPHHYIWGKWVPIEYEVRNYFSFTLGPFLQLWTWWQHVQSRYSKCQKILNCAASTKPKIYTRTVECGFVRTFSVFHSVLC